MPLSTSNIDARQIQGPLTSSQQVIWDLYKKPGSANNNMYYSLKIDGSLDLTRWQTSLKEMAARHEPLRTRYLLSTNGQVQAHVDSTTNAVIKILDFADIPLSEAMQKISELSDSEANWHFDLAVEHPLRAVLIVLNQETCICLLTVHHIAFDGWSMEIFCREWRQIFANEHLDTLPDIPFQCVDAAQAQKRWLSNDEANQQMLWWEQQFREYSPPPAIKALEHKRLDIPYLRIVRYVTSIPAPVYSSLKDYSAMTGYSLYALFLAAYSIVLSNHFKTQNLMIGSLVANRRIPEAAKCLGSFYNNTVYPLLLDSNVTIMEHLEMICSRHLEVLDRQELPFAQLQKKMALLHGGDAHCLSQFMLMMDAYPVESLAFRGTSTKGIYFKNTTLNNYDESSIVDEVSQTSIDKTLMLMETLSDIIFFVRKSQDTATLSVFFKVDLMDETTILWMINSFIAVLTQLTEEGDVLISDVILPPKFR